MELQCDICFANYDLEAYRPKSLPCGHTFCKCCVQNPGLGRKCPTCRKDLAADPDGLPDNILAIQLIENDGAPLRKRPKKEDPEVQQLQRGVDAARKVVDALRLTVPKAVEALNRQLDMSVAQLRQLEEALEQQVQRRAGGDQGSSPEQLQTAEQMEDSLRLLTTNNCSVVIGENGSSWKASVQLSESSDILRLLLLQLRADGQLAKVDDIHVSPSASGYVGPPMLGILTIKRTDLTEGNLKVDEIIRAKRRMQNIRSIRGLQGEGSDKLLRVVASHSLHVEELWFSGEVEPKVMEVVQKMTSLKRLFFESLENHDDYPDLPSQLEELTLNSPCEQQLDSVMRMPGLRSLKIWNYFGANLTFPSSEYGTLRWLGVCFDPEHKPTMLSLIRAHASSLQELLVYCDISEVELDDNFYLPDLGQELAACGLLHLRRLVLYRSNFVPCTDIAGCLIQLQNLRGFLPSSVEVVCDQCTTSVLW